MPGRAELSPPLQVLIAVFVDPYVLHMLCICFSYAVNVLQLGKFKMLIRG